MTAYIAQFRYALAMEKTQIIQFSVLAYLRPGIPFETFFGEFHRPAIKLRICEICDSVRKRLSFGSKLENVLVRAYPHFNRDDLEAEPQSPIQFATDDDLRHFVLQICGAVLWFDGFGPAVASVLAFLVKCLRVPFPLEPFVDLLCAEVAHDRFAELFWELQVFEQFRYADFLRYLIKQALFSSRKDAAARLILDLPCAASHAYVLGRLDAVLARHFPGNSFNDDLAAVGSDVEKNIEIGRRLPRVLRYQLAMLVIDNASDFAACARVVLELDAPIVIVGLFRNTAQQRIPLRLAAKSAK
jgi:hypothetical protein